jgi:hypothetical protein
MSTELTELDMSIMMGYNPDAPSRVDVAAELGRRGYKFANFSYTPGPDAGSKTASEIADSIEAAMLQVKAFHDLPEADQLWHHLNEARAALHKIMDMAHSSIEQFMDPATRPLSLLLSDIGGIADMALITLPEDPKEREDRLERKRNVLK